MKRMLIAFGSALLLIGCAHYRGGTASDSEVSYGSDISNGANSDLNDTTNQSNHIEKSRQPEYPSQTQPRFD